MSFLIRQDGTPKFARQVLPDQTESGLMSYVHFIYQVQVINSHKIRSLDTNLGSKANKQKYLEKKIFLQKF